MEWDEEKLLMNVRKADTDDLLDRITAYRAGMEPNAIDMIERELHQRGISAARIIEQLEIYERECVFHADGSAKMCSQCRNPAVREGWGWHRLMGSVPIFPRRMRFCKDHDARLAPRER